MSRNYNEQLNTKLSVLRVLEGDERLEPHGEKPLGEGKGEERGEGVVDQSQSQGQRKRTLRTASGTPDSAVPKSHWTFACLQFLLHVYMCACTCTCHSAHVRESEDSL